MSTSEIVKNAEAIISIDARGFIFGSAMSLQSSKPISAARKHDKLPGELLKITIVSSMVKVHFQFKKNTQEITHMPLMMIYW